MITTTNQMTKNNHLSGVPMLLQEELARERMRESQREAAQLRLARRLASARRWNRLARWASRRAADAERAL